MATMRRLGGEVIGVTAEPVTFGCDYGPVHIPPGARIMVPCVEVTKVSCPDLDGSDRTGKGA